MPVVSSSVSTVLVLVALLIAAPSTRAHGGEAHEHGGAEHAHAAAKAMEPAAENAVAGTPNTRSAVDAAPPSIDAGSQAPQSVAPADGAAPQSSAASRIAMIVAGAFAGLAALIMLLGAVRRRTNRHRAHAAYETPDQASHAAWTPHEQPLNAWPAEDARAWPEQPAANSRAAAAGPLR